MKTLLKISWRNIWRHKLRSAVVMISIMLGIWAGIFVSSFSFGLNEQRKQGMIKGQISHLQIHQPEFTDQQAVEYLIPANNLRAELAADSLLEAFSSRVIANGMVASSHYSGGAQIIGVDPVAEAGLTGLAEKVVDGAYFSEKGRNPIILGRALAQKLEARIGSRVVLSFSDAQRNIVSASFKVKGIYSDVSSQVEKSRLYVRQSDLKDLLGAAPNEVHEWALLAKENEAVEGIAKRLQTQYPQLKVDTWKTLSPELAYADEVMTQALYWIIGIIMLALSFGIINTMLMAVLERKRELGMLMSVGMNRARIFGMIILETLFLALTGGPMGIFLGYFSVQAAARHGLDLSMFSEGLASYGIDTIIYPLLPTSFYWGTGLMVFFMTLLAAVYPARHALKLNPVESLRSL